MSGLTHFDAEGRAVLVYVTAKPVTDRTATARARVVMEPATLQTIVLGTARKGDVLGTARLAGIMAAKKKPVAALTLADVGVDGSEVGLAHALGTVTSASPKPPKSAGEKVDDEGDGGAKIAAFLVSQKLI